MRNRQRKAREEAIGILKKGGVGVMPTDTLYGLVGSAKKRSTIARLYALRKRNPNKPLIVLIASPRGVGEFCPAISGEEKKILRAVWPGKVSVILPCPNKKFLYLHRGTKTLAFRVPRSKKLQEFLRQTGPLAAPSANPQGLVPAKTLFEARAYFGDTVDFYLPGGKKKGAPSTLIEVTEGKVVVLRKGAVAIPKVLK